MKVILQNRMIKVILQYIIYESNITVQNSKVILQYRIMKVILQYRIIKLYYSIEL